MKHKFSSMGRVAIALVLALSLTLVMALPVAATHTSSATVTFHPGESQLVGETSVLDVEVTNGALSLGNINEVKIDFSATEFTSIGKGTEPTNWTGVVEDSVITYTAAAGAEILADASLTFYPTVTNPEEPGLVDPNPTVTTSDPGNTATVTVDTDIVVTAQDPGAAGNGISIAVTVTSSDLGGNSATVEVSRTLNDITVAVTNDSNVAPETVTRKAVADALNMSTNGTLSGADYTGTEVGDEIVNVTITDDVTGTVVGSGGSDADAAAVTQTFLANGEPQEQSYAAGGALTIKEFAVTAGPTFNTSATATDYTISFTTLNPIAATTGTIIIAFPSGYDISLLEAGDITMTVAGGGYDPLTKAIDAVARTVTITADTAIAADTAVEVTTANTHVKNPPTSGTYDIDVLTSGGDDGSGEVTIVPVAFKVVAGDTNTVTATTAFAVTVTALNDADPAETDTGYTGDRFIDFAWMGAPAGTPTLLAFDLITFTAGEGTSDQYFVLTDVDTDIQITADATEPTLTGNSGVITINPAGVFSFTIEGDELVGTITAGDAFTNDITVTALDAELNIKTDYVGTVTWSSTDEQAIPGDGLPAAYTFTETDAGEHTFLATDSEFILRTAGTQTITVTDEVADVVKVSDTPITVEAADATELEVVVDVGVIRANGTDQSVITASAVDDFGNVDETYTTDITFDTSLGGFVEAAGANTYTDDPTGTGVSIATLGSDDVGTTIIKVTSGDFNPVTTNVKLLPLIDIDSIEVTVDKSTILNNSVDVRTITATYLDSGSKVVTAASGADYTVTFTTDDVADPPEVTLNPADGVVVPVDGVATVTLTTTKVAGTTILVTATGTGETDALDAAIDVNEGTFDITLSQGWNLISLPLVPVYDSIDVVLADITENVIQVRTWVYEDGALIEKIWAEGGAVGGLSKMVDGQGYWIETEAATLTATGSEIPAPPQTPPSYSVYEGWNMIGFTSLETLTSAENYLGIAVTGTFEAMYGYDAVTGLYEVVETTPTVLVPGQGYWLAVNADGTIYP